MCLHFFKTDPLNAFRLKEIEADELRDNFQRDRDRILYSREFRRLSGKTQVFVTSHDDNLRTRLTHTLEVAQISNTIAQNLNLNTTLTEAIALGHDVGHTPFGHIGERILNYLMNGCQTLANYEEGVWNCLNCKGFKHNLQGIRVACDLEKMNNSEPGLNLTNYTLWGILNHTKKSYKSQCEHYRDDEKCTYFLNKDHICHKKGKLEVDFYNYLNGSKYKNLITDENSWSIEGAIVAMADEIAQRHHDIEDGIYARILDIDDIIQLLKKYEKILSFEKDFKLDDFKKSNKYNILYRISKLIIRTYTIHYSNYLKKLFTGLPIKSQEE